MAINDWPAGERPREKLISAGASSLSDAELLAIFLRSGVRGQDAVNLARALLKRSDGLKSLLDSGFREFCALPGCGPAAYASLRAALELGHRYRFADLVHGPGMNSTDQVAEYLIHRMKPYRQEVFACLFLDTQHRVLDFRNMFYGTIDAAPVYPREIVRACLETNSAAIILAHNHPSGVAEPSQADCAITNRIRDAVTLIDVRLLDHFVVGATDAVSMAASGLLGAG